MTSTRVWNSSLLAAAIALAAGCELGGPSVGPGQQQEAGGTCTSCDFLGSAAVCLDRSHPLVQVALADETAAGILEQNKAACAGADELCIPCTDPRTGTNTGACQLAECTDDAGGTLPANCEAPAQLADPNLFPACAPGGRCVAAALVPPEAAGRLPACTQTPGGLCVPDEAVRFGTAYRPSTCSVGGAGGLEGRCLATFIPEVQEQLGTLPVSTECAANVETCVPCYDPVTGEGTGACALTSCDAPTQPAQSFASCGDGALGRCVPLPFLAGQNLENLDQRDCAQATTMCVPTRVLTNAQPLACDGSGFFVGDYPGVCLNTDILDISGSGFLPTENCDEDLGDGHKCVPCLRDGAPTDAPGCDVLYNL